MAHSPLFQASLTWDGSQGLDLQLGDLQLQPLDEQAAFAKFDLALSVGDSAEHFRCIVEYATALFDRGTVERYLGYLQAILRGMVADGRTVVNHIPLLSEAERRQLTDGFNASDVVYPQGQTLHSQFEAQAQRTPDAIAVSFAEQSWSYATLNAQANKIAHRLIGLGIGEDDRVAICTHRGLEMIAGLLGILKAGAAYVPLDPAYPLERIAYTLSDSTPVALLSQRSVQEALPVSQVPVISLDDAGLQDESERNPQVPVKPTSLAYVIYTSGSTGKPKGVMIEHRNVARLFSATEDWFGFNEQDVWSLFHSFAFDFSVWEIWGALLHGGRLLIVPQLVSRSPEDFYALLCSAGVTVLNQTPSAFRQLIAAQGENPKAHSLRQVIFGGEALETAMLKPWYARNVNAGTQLVNMYGITETT
ncbi:non-ribosomal peptide synthetase SyfB, partial [Pseudomonas syringae pv. actinidiae ICMP 18807]